MFTGLIEDVGTVEWVQIAADGARLRFATELGRRVAPGESVAVNGVCLTATATDEGGFVADAMNQTLTVTTLGDLETGSRVNLEMAMRPDDRLGGHIVQGHVDGVGAVAEVSEDGFARRVRVELPRELMRYVIDKGSIALNGASLTIVDLGESWVSVSLIPETLERTNLDSLAPGDRLNVECDVIAKHVERLLAPFAGKERA
jgi:riboflavin synthase